MPKITPYKGNDTIRVGKSESDPKTYNARWWKAKSDRELAASVFGVVNFLKKNQGWRQNQAALFARLYGNLPIWNYLGINLSKLNAQYRFPAERPTLNVVQSCTDALVARMVQSKPKPMFITDAGDTVKRKTAKQLNKFVDGEFYQIDAYQLGEQVLRDACVLGDGVLKVFEDDKGRVTAERVLCTELFVDETDAMYGKPQGMFQLKIMDRDVAAEVYPEHRSSVYAANPAYFDSSTEAQNSISSQIMIVEAWRLPSGYESGDGRHVIAIDNDILLKEEWTETDFPFVKFPYAPRTLGYWAQGLAEQLMGLQSEINRLLYVAQQALHLCGVPKWLIEDGSRIVSAHVNNQIGGFIKYQGTPPVLQSFQCLPPEHYAQLERLVNYAYQQSGVSQLAAASKKPSGLNSGAAIREFDDLQADRFAFIQDRYQSFFLDLAKKMYRKAKMIAERDGSYSTIYPGKNTISKIELPLQDLDDDDFIIQAFPVSSLSKNPSMRKQQVIDDMQAGLIDPAEGRRLIDYPDLQQTMDLLIAPEERLLQILDEIVEDGKYTPPDSTMDLALAKRLVLQYYNKYMMGKVDPAKADMLRTFNTQIEVIQQAAAQPPPAMPVAAPQATPEPTPVSPMIPNVQGAI